MFALFINFLKNLFRKTIVIRAGEVGIVTTHIGAPLAEGEKAAFPLKCHVTHFQDMAQFVKLGGKKGLQEEVLLPGSYRLSAKHVSVKKVPFVTVPKNHMAVLAFNLTSTPIYNTISEPGSYPINTDITTISLVPLTHMVLNWSDLRMAAHRLDSDLKSIILEFPPDTLEFNVSLVIKINEISAVHLISDFGSIKNFVNEVMNLAVCEFFNAYVTAENYTNLEENKADFQDQLKYKLDPIFGEFKVEIIDAFMNNFKVLRASV